MSQRVSKRLEQKEFEQEVFDAIEEAFDGEPIKVTDILKDYVGKKDERHKKQESAILPRKK